MARARGRIIGEADAEDVEGRVRGLHAEDDTAIGAVAQEIILTQDLRGVVVVGKAPCPEGIVGNRGIPCPQFFRGQRELFDELDAPVGLVSSLEIPMPYAKSLESVILPSKERCLAVVRKTLSARTARP